MNCVLTDNCLNSASSIIQKKSHYSFSLWKLHTLFHIRQCLHIVSMNQGTQLRVVKNFNRQSLSTFLWKFSATWHFMNAIHMTLRIATSWLSSLLKKLLLNCNIFTAVWQHTAEASDSYIYVQGRQLSFQLLEYESMQESNLHPFATKNSIISNLMSKFLTSMCTYNPPTHQPHPQTPNPKPQTPNIQRYFTH